MSRMHAGVDIASTVRGLQIVWLGHACVVVRQGATTLLFDPVLRPRLAHLRRRERILLETVGDVDAVFVSHAHHDHLDIASLRIVRRIAPVGAGWHAPRGAARVLERARLSPVKRCTVGDETRVGELRIRTVAAAHGGERFRWARNELGAEAVGYVVETAEGLRTWFAGDTAFDPDVLASIGQVDVALVPVGGWWRTLGPGHMDGAQAARAVEFVGARVAVPIHWGTYHPIGLFRAMRAIWHDPAHELVRAAPEGVDVRVLEIGGATVVDPETST